MSNVADDSSTCFFGIFPDLDRPSCNMRHLGNTFELLFLAPEHWILSGNGCNVMKQCGRPMQIFPMMWIVLKNCNIISKRQSFSTLMTSLSHILRYEDLFLRVIYQEHHCCVWASEHHQASISLTCWAGLGCCSGFHKQGGQAQEGNWKIKCLLWNLGKCLKVIARTTHQPGPSEWTLQQIWSFSEYGEF